MTAAPKIVVQWHRPLAPKAVLQSAARYVTTYGWHCPPGLYGPTGRVPRRPEMLPASMLGAVRAAVYGIPKWWPQTVAAEVRPLVLAGYAAAVDHLTGFLETTGHAELATVAWFWERNLTRSPRDVIGALHAAAACASVREPDPDALGVDGGDLAVVLPMPTRPAVPVTAPAVTGGGALFQLDQHVRRRPSHTF